jgi:hypothetical protein
VRPQPSGPHSFPVQVGVQQLFVPGLHTCGAAHPQSAEQPTQLSPASQIPLPQVSPQASHCCRASSTQAESQSLGALHALPKAWTHASRAGSLQPEAEWTVQQSLVGGNGHLSMQPVSDRA